MVRPPLYESPEVTDVEVVDGCGVVEGFRERHRDTDLVGAWVWGADSEGADSEGEGSESGLRVIRRKVRRSW